MAEIQNLVLELAYTLHVRVNLLVPSPSEHVSLFRELQSHLHNSGNRFHLTFAGNKSFKHSTLVLSNRALNKLST